MSEEWHAIPPDLYKRLNQDFIDETGQQTYDTLPKEFDDWINLVKFFIAHSLALRGKIPTPEHYEYLKETILQQYTHAITVSVRQVATDAIESYEVWAYPCVLCNDRTTRKHVVHNDIHVCVYCYDHQTRIVKANKSRAREKGLLATLTTEEWILRLVQYNQCCAYCGNPYHVLEHNIPLSRAEKYDIYSYEQRGTIYPNCFPACNACNRKKNDRFPDEVRHIRIRELA